MFFYEGEPVKSAVVVGALGAGAALLLGKEVGKWGAVGAGVGFVGSLLSGRGHGGSHLVGAGVPPGSDYSFTRAPGFNDKNY